MLLCDDENKGTESPKPSEKSWNMETAMWGFFVKKYADFSLLSFIGQQRSSFAYTCDEFMNENICQFKRLHKINR